jgi:putative two-component system response regulator
MGRKPRILTIDDSRSVQLRYADLLRATGADVDAAADGEEGLEKALASTYDIIITDVKMPKMSGIDLCHALQAVPKTRHIPTIIISNFDSDKDIESGLEAGAAAYISKRDVQALLVKTVADLLWKSSHLNQRTILVVDNSLSVQRYVELGLKAKGFNVERAENGEDAMIVMGKMRPDLILSDIQMPKVDGFELCKWVKSRPRLASIPFVVMSSSDDKIYMNRMLQYGAASYVVKPFALNQLIDLIDRILSDSFLILLRERDRVYSERENLLAGLGQIVSVLEAKDPYTKGHSEAVSRTTAKLLELGGASPSDIETIALGARLHDIGKIGIRDSVLLKPWKLSPEEFAHVKQHTVIGKQLIESIPSLSGLSSIAYSHHERWDGTGYPLGLKGKEIPLWARITAVADTYDALSHRRPYREAYPEEEVHRIIEEASGTQLCPNCVALFFDWIKQK